MRGGGGMRGGGAGLRGGGFGGGFRGGVGAGFRGGFGGGFRNGFGAFRGGFNGGFGRGFYGRGFYGRGFYPGFYGGYGFWPYFGFGYADYWPYAYAPYGAGYGYAPYDYGYATYQPSPNVTVIYPEQAATVSAQPARPVTRDYDQYGQEVRPAGSPLYLIAFKDHTIRAAISYQVEGSTLHYVTMEHEDKQAPLETVDRALSLQLNRERRVPFQLPQQQ